MYVGAIGSSRGGGGNMLRYEHNVRQQRIVTVWPEVQGSTINMSRGLYGHVSDRDTGQAYRFQWTYPINISPHDPNVIYTCGQYVFRSTDDGTSWEIISPDLTRNDTAKMEELAAPPRTGITPYDICTIFAFVESPHEQGVFWTGSDDGMVHVSRDGSKSWQEVTPPELPEWALVSTIEVSPHDPATAYVAATSYQFNDYRPYLFKTNDYGASWESITAGIPETHYTRVIREDPKRRGLLYAGTEAGVYVSLDDGASWQSLRLEMPPVAIHDLIVKEDDLVTATYGRGLWILDDLTSLHQLTDEVLAAPVHLFRPRETYRLSADLIATWLRSGDPPPRGTSRKGYMVGLGVPATFEETQGADGRIERRFLDCGENPPEGVIVVYHLQERPAGEVRLEFLDDQGEVIRSFSSEPPENPNELSPDELDPTVPAAAGANRFVWDMRYAGARRIAEEEPKRQPTFGQVLAGPVATPGNYRARLIVDGASSQQGFEIRKDPRVAATLEDLDAQFELLMQIRDRISTTHDAVNTLRSVRQQVQEWELRAAGQSDTAPPDAVAESGRALREKLDAIDEAFTGSTMPWQPRGSRTIGGLAAKIAGVPSVVGSAEWVPTQQSYDVLKDLSARIEQQERLLNATLAEDVGAFNELLREHAVPAVASR